MKKVVVMGIGNYILSDEGIGVHVVKAIENEPWPENVEIFDCGTLGILASYKIAEADVLIAIDAIVSKEEPGSVKVFDKEDIMLSKVPAKVSPHQIGFQETLLHAQLRGDCPEVVKLIGVVPESYDTSTELSDACKAALPKIVEIVRQLVAEYA
ncbi:MAG: HyaD/HybD family hydrogenase maturation endopeptidase [Deferribacterales bacterium]|nr:HyaD/HybD family hydrogenase maturation endopeptidase [Deferribacterales bacterium]